MNMYSETQQGN